MESKNKHFVCVPVLCGVDVVVPIVRYARCAITGKARIASGESDGKMEKFESEDPELQPFVPPSLHLHKDGEQMSPKEFPKTLVHLNNFPFSSSLYSIYVR